MKNAFYHNNNLVKLKFKKQIKEEKNPFRKVVLYLNLFYVLGLENITKKLF